MQNPVNWQDVPMPPSVAKLPRDRRGYPIPANVLWQNGKPIFAANDARFEIDAVKNGLCSVTGDLLKDDDVWLIAGPRSILDPRGMVFDHPVCREAKDYSMRVCPYLATPHYKGLSTQAKVNLAAKVGGTTNNPLRPWQDMEVQVAAKVRGIRIALDHENGILYLPTRDYVVVEVWSGGRVLEHYAGADAVRPLLKRHWPKDVAEFQLPDHFQQAIKGAWSGIFPWSHNPKRKVNEVQKTA